MRVRWVRIAAQRVDDEQVDALEEVDHLDGKLRKIGGIGDLVRTVAEDQARRLDRPVRHLDRRHLDRPDRLMIAKLDRIDRRHWSALSSWARSEEHTSELQSLMRHSYAGF